MTFSAILVGLLFFAAGFAVHLLWWRLSRPRDDFRALAISFFVLPIILAVLGYLGLFPVTLEPREWLAAYVMEVLVSSTYIMYYPAAQAASPTMLLVLQISRSAKTGGASRASLRAVFDNELLCRQSIANLVHEHFADERDGKLVVAPRGAFLLQMLNSWRKLLGLKYGSG